MRPPTSSRPKWGGGFATFASTGGSQTTPALSRAKARGSAPTRVQRAKTIETRIDRLRVSREAGAISDEAEYRREVARLRLEFENARHAPEPQLEQQARALRTLADDWDQMLPARRKRVLETMFCELRMRDDALESATPVPDWLPYLEQVTGVPSEGLVGLEPTTPALGRRRSIR